MPGGLKGRRPLRFDIGQYQAINHDPPKLTLQARKGLATVRTLVADLDWGYHFVREHNGDHGVNNDDYSNIHNPSGPRRLVGYCLLCRARPSVTLLVAITKAGHNTISKKSVALWLLPCRARMLMRC